jgi:histidine triad (HIT) family protein
VEAAERSRSDLTAPNVVSFLAMPANDRCLFCRIARGEISAKKIFEDDHVVAFNDINPQAPVHVLVIPRQHIASLDDLNEDDAAAVGITLVRVAEIARTLQLNGQGYRVVANHGEDAGQTVFHIHFHLLGGRNLSWPPG